LKTAARLAGQYIIGPRAGYALHVPIAAENT
jgi:hypothetical protein